MGSHDLILFNCNLWFISECAVTGALKCYLRELPEPLMTFELYSDWFKAAGCVWYQYYLFLISLWFQSWFLSVISSQGKKPDREAGAVPGTSEETSTWKLQQPQVFFFFFFCIITWLNVKFTCHLGKNASQNSQYFRGEEDAHKQLHWNVVLATLASSWIAALLCRSVSIFGPGWNVSTKWHTHSGHQGIKLTLMIPWLSCSATLRLTFVFLCEPVLLLFAKVSMLTI